VSVACRAPRGWIAMHLLDDERDADLFHLSPAGAVTVRAPLLEGTRLFGHPGGLDQFAAFSRVGYLIPSCSR
jgi:hypothetical protein